MFNIRRNVFETNSSSSHSISIKSNSGELTPNYIYIDEDNIMHTEFGEFGWGYETYTDQSNKLSYVVTMMGALSGTYDESLYEYGPFIHLKEDLIEYTGCSDLVIDSFDGYVDHQSVCNIVEDYCEVENYINFIYNSNIKLIIDNDNH